MQDPVAIPLRFHKCIYHVRQWNKLHGQAFESGLEGLAKARDKEKYK